MKKHGGSIPLYYGALLMACLIWLGLAVFQLEDYLSAIFFLCILLSAVFIKYLEKEIWQERYDRLQKREKRMEAKSWYYESIVTNSRDILFTTDLDHRIVKFNKGSEEAFGIMAFEVLGKHVHNLFEEPDRIDALLEEVAAKGRSRVIETMIRNQESRGKLWLSVGVSKLFDINNGDSALVRDRQFLGEIFTCKNITQRINLENELKEKNEQLTHLSITDSLTGLYNLRHLQSEATRLQKLHHRFPERSLSLALLDVDRFKEYNDKFGHLAGDKLLITLSDVIQMQIRKDLDLAFRYGGDEFVLVFPDTDVRGSRIICERVLQDFNDYHFGSTSLSIGITRYQKEWGLLSENVLVAKADEAMYMVKCKGGSGIHVHGQPLNEELAGRADNDSQQNLR